MANLTAQAVWDEIYSIAEDDPVQGGDGGIDNIPHQQLANRTAFLKVEIDSAKGDIPDGENASLASLLQRIKNLEGKPAPTLPEMPTIKQFMIPVGGLFETVKPYANGGELTTDMGYGTWERYGEGRSTLGLTTAPVDDGAGNIGVFNQIGLKFGEYDHVLTVNEMPSHKHSIRLSHEFASAGYAGDTTGFPSTNATEPFVTHSDTEADNSTSLTTGSGNPLGSIGGNQAHNNMPPVIVVGRWVRTA